MQPFVSRPRYACTMYILLYYTVKYSYNSVHSSWQNKILKLCPVSVPTILMTLPPEISTDRIKLWVIILAIVPYTIADWLLFPMHVWLFYFWQWTNTSLWYHLRMLTVMTILLRSSSAMFWYVTCSVCNTLGLGSLLGKSIGTWQCPVLFF